MLFRYRKTKQPQAGAEAYGFDTGQLNPVFPLFSGIMAGSISPVQPAPMYYPSPLGPISGIGGLIYNPGYFTPLMASRKSR